MTKKELEKIIQDAKAREAKELDLSRKGLTQLPESLGQLSALQTLFLTGNQLTELPESVGQLSALQTLSIHGNQLTQLPESLSQFSTLQVLDLSGNQLTELPESFGQLSALRTLYLFGNQLTQLPESLGQLSVLHRLYLTDNQLTELPESVGQLSALRKLYLSGNQLVQIPKSLGQLSALQALDISRNQLTQLPESLCQLSALLTLDISDNQLTQLPESLLALAKRGELKTLFLHGNGTLNLPPEVLGPSWDECENQGGTKKPARPRDILEYYFRTRPGATAGPLNESKLILVGRGGVGKTSLIHRLINGERPPETKRTEGIAVTNWQVTVDDTEVRLNVWDFGGQEMMHATHQFFLTERSVYLLVVSNREGMAATDAEYWLKLIQSFGGHSPVLLVRNKIDETPFELDEEVLREKYPMMLGESVATDALSGTGCKALAQRLQDAIAQHQEWKQPIPANWWAVKNEIEKLPTSHLCRDEFNRLCEKHGEKSVEEQERLARILKQLGVIIHYWEDPRLRETAVLRPQWLTGGIYLLLNDPKLKEARGITHLADLARILPRKDYPEAQQTFLLEVMRKFRLCHEVPQKEGTWLLPELLPEAQPAGLGAWTEQDCLALRYEYAVLPEGLVPRLIAQAFPLVHEKQQWRFGVVLALEGALARVRADRMERRVNVLVREGDRAARKKLLAYIRACFDEMHDEFERLEVKTQFRPEGADSQWEDYDRLVKLEQANPADLAKTEYGTVNMDRVAAKLNSVDTPIERINETRAEHLYEGFFPRVETGHLFVSFCHADRQLKAELDIRLKILKRQRVISHWDDAMIPPGGEWNHEILDKLGKAAIVLLLVSPDFMASDYINDKEVPLAMELHEQKKAIVIPIILRTCNWKRQPYAKLQSPSGGQPIVGHKHTRDRAWQAVEDAIVKAVESL